MRTTERASDVDFAAIERSVGALARLIAAWSDVVTAALPRRLREGPLREHLWDSASAEESGEPARKGRATRKRPVRGARDGRGVKGGAAWAAAGRRRGDADSLRTAVVDVLRSAPEPMSPADRLVALHNEGRTGVTGQAVRLALFRLARAGLVQRTAGPRPRYALAAAE